MERFGPKLGLFLAGLPFGVVCVNPHPPDSQGTLTRTHLSTQAPAPVVTGT
jgi:hypothetical protein